MPNPLKQNRIPPDEIRELLIHADGLWEIHVDAAVSGKAATVKALRRILGWSLAEAAEALKNVSGSVYTGTVVEAEWVRRQLCEANISSRREVAQRL